MKRLNNNSAISKLGESAYNALVMTNQVNGDEKRILHYSYNLSVQEGPQCSFNEDSYGTFTRKNKPLFGSQRITRRAFSKEENETKRDFEKGVQRSNSIGHLPYNNNETANINGLTSLKASSHSEATPQGCVLERPTADVPRNGTDDRVTQNNVSRETHTRKYGLGEPTNVSLMSHKLRKKAVCDSTDNSHYQRQFLRVLNKRF